MLRDNYDFYREHERRQEEWLESRPVCGECGEPIQDDSAYYINNNWICNKCMEDFKKYID